MPKRHPKQITDKKELDYLYNLTEKDITTSFIMDNFGEFNKKTKYNPYDELVIPPHMYHNDKLNNDKAFKTTIGSWAFNKLFIEKELMHLFGYTNEEISGGTMKKINKKLSYALLENDIELDVLRRFLMKTQSSMSWVTILSTHHTLKMLTLAKSIEGKKKELAKKYEKDLAEGNAEVAEKMEEELLSYAKEILDGDESLDWVFSGSRTDFGNHIKNMYVMKGAIKDPISGNYNIVTSNYSSGISKEDYPAMCNSLAAGPFSRSNKTQIGGYYEKLLLYAYQHLVLLEEGSDCKTNKYITVDFSEENIEDYMYSYVIEGSNLTEITSKNISKYKGKKVKLRFSSMCSAKDGICHKCAGNFFYRLGIKNVGTIMPILGSKLKNLAMKSFHSSLVKFTEIDMNKVFNIK